MVQENQIEGINNDEWIFSMSKNFHRMNSKDQAIVADMIDSLQNPPALPKHYKKANKRFNKILEKANANPIPVTDEQLYAIDQQLVRTRYQANISDQILASVTDYQTNPRWVEEHYTISGDTFPGFSKGINAFQDIFPLKLGVEPTLVDGVGWHIEWDLPFTLLDASAGGIYNIDSWHSFKAGELMGVIGDRRNLLGTACESTSGDLGVTGLHNYSGLTTQATGAGADNNITAAGDIDFTIRALLGNLPTVYEPGENHIISTSGPASEVYAHDATYTDRTEYEILQKKWFDSGVIKGWWVTNNLEADTNATTTGRIMMVKIGRSTVKRSIIYPFQKRPNLDKRFESDVKYTILEASIIKYYNVAAGVICSGDQTSTSAGFIPNGLFMTGNGSGLPRPTNIGAV